MAVVKWHGASDVQSPALKAQKTRQRTEWREAGKYGRKKGRMEGSLTTNHDCKISHRGFPTVYHTFLHLFIQQSWNNSIQALKEAANQTPGYDALHRTFMMTCCCNFFFLCQRLFKNFQKLPMIYCIQSTGEEGSKFVP